jgi:spore germination protein
MPHRTRHGRSALLALAVAAGLLGELVLAGAPAQAATKHRIVSAWLPYWSYGTAAATVTRNNDVVGVANPFWYNTSSGGVIVRKASIAGNAAAIARLRRANLRVEPTITSSFSARYAAVFFNDTARRRKLAAAVAGLAAKHRYQGIDLNHEQLAVTTDPKLAARVRKGFTQFVREVCTRLHQAKRRCTVTVMARTSDRDEVWRGKLLPSVYDYARLGAAADRINVMAYDQHANNGAGPIAGYPWVEQIVRYVVTRVPRHKVSLGIPLYGREWYGSTYHARTWSQAAGQARTARATVRWSATQKERWYRYTAGGRTRTVWFTDQSSVAARIALARKYRLGGVAYWAPSQESPQVWAATRRWLTW